MSGKKRLEDIYNSYNSLIEICEHVKSLLINQPNSSLGTKIIGPYQKTDDKRGVVKNYFDSLQQIITEHYITDIISTFEHIVFMRINDAYGVIKGIVNDEYEKRRKHKKSNRPAPLYKSKTSFIKNIEDVKTLGGAKTLLEKQIEELTTCCKLTDKSLINLKSESVPNAIINRLEAIKNQRYAERTEFIDALIGKIGEDQTSKYKKIIMKYGIVIMKKSKRETADRLAKTHFEIEPNIKRIFLLEPVNEHDPNDPIRLLEVVEGTIERGIEPIAFTADPARGIEYPSVIVEISPREYKHICDGTLDLSERGWMVGTELPTSKYR